VYKTKQNNKTQKTTKHQKQQKTENRKQKTLIESLSKESPLHPHLVAPKIHEFLTISSLFPFSSFLPSLPI